MNRLKQLLFAGTLVPAIALTPFSGAFAQAPDQDRGPPGGATRAAPGGGGAMHGPQGGPGGAMNRETQHGGAMRGEGPRAAGAGAGSSGGERQRAETPQRSQTRDAAESPRERKAQHAGEAAQTRPGGGSTPGTERTPRAADAQRTTPGATPSAEGRTRREAAEPETGSRRTGAAERTGGADAQRSAPGATPGASGRTRREAAEPETGTRRAGGAGGPAERTGAVPAASPAERNAATPPVAPNRAGNAAQDERRSAPNGTAQGDRRGAPANAAQDERRGAPNNAAERGTDRMQNDRRDNADRGDRNDRGRRDADRGDRGISPGGAAAIGAAAGFAGGFLAATSAQRLDDVRRDRREIREDGRTYIREPGRTIVEDGDRSYIVHDENDRFRELGYDVRRERRGRDYVDTVDRPGGVQIITYTDDSGRMLRRVRRDRSGHEFVLIDNSYDGGVRNYRDDVVDLPPPPMRIARDRYAVDYGAADEGLIYDTLVAPPLAAPPKRYTLDQIRYSPDVRSYVRSVDINTINFDSGSWIVPASATGKLQALATAIKRATERNPNSVFLVEGYTDLTGNPTDNLSLSDRRAQSVAAILTKSFNVPPENLTTQGYGQQNPKVNTQGPSVENRRVVVQNITQLLASNDQAPPVQ